MMHLNKYNMDNDENIIYGSIRSFIGQYMIIKTTIAIGCNDIGKSSKCRNNMIKYDISHKNRFTKVLNNLNFIN